MPVLLEHTTLIPYGVIYWQETALSLYHISPIEAALHPLGIISYSSCGLDPFVDGILNFERVMEYRVGVVRTIERYWPSGPSRLCLLFQFVNGRGFENWVRLDLSKPISWVTPYSIFESTSKILTFGFDVDGKMKLLSLLRLRGKLWLEVLTRAKRLALLGKMYCQ